MIGVDEVGRGAWAGPLLVVAVRLKKGKKLPAGLSDSKKLTKRRRELLVPQIIEVCDVGQGWVAAGVIDEKGLSDSLRSACMLAVFQLEAARGEHITIDGSVDFLRDTQYKNVETVVKADLTEPLVSAASVVAKVLRDQFMAECSDEFPEYFFERHVGYGTTLHRKALEKYGVTMLHRQSFRPVANLSTQR